MDTYTKLQHAALFLPLFLIFLIACQQPSSTAKQDGLLAEGIFIEWEVVSNQVDDEPRCRTLFQIENRSKQVLGNQGWAIYYNQNADDVIPGSATNGISVTLLSGDFYRFAPEPGFQLSPGEKRNIEVDHSRWMIKEDQSPIGLYMVFYEKGGKERSRFPLNNFKVRPFTRPEQLNRFTYDQTPDPTPQWQYEQNEKLSLLDQSELPLIIPRPASMSLEGSYMVLDNTFEIHHEKGLENEASMLSSHLEELTGIRIEFLEQEEMGEGILYLGKDDHLSTAESYRLEITKERGISIWGSDAAAVFYGNQSLLALIPIENFSERLKSITLPVCKISDEPRFPYRGMHLDVARNFNDKEAVFKLLDVMSFYKLNKLHLHLTDDEGWRLQSRALPELTEVGAFRGHTLDDQDFLHPSYGSGPEPDPSSGNGTGFYTIEDYTSILKYAHARHIEVIPEYDFPGHARAAIMAMNTRYRKFMEAGDEKRATEYLLSDPDDSSVYHSAQSFDDNVICVCRESVYRFMETIIDEVVEIHKEAQVPLTTIHIGGDEVPGGAWQKSPICQDFQEGKEKAGGASELMDYFLARTGELLRERKLNLSGWEEITLDRDESGVYVVKPPLESPGYRVYIWDNFRPGNQDIGYKIANAGYPVILCSVTNYYFELAYTKDPKEPGEYWGGFVDTRKAFEYIPFDVFKSISYNTLGRPYDPGVDFQDMVRLNPKAKDLLLGLQGCLWSESIFGPESLEYFTLPKMLGLAERAWSPQASWETIDEKELREKALEADWNIFANALGQRELPRLDYLSGGFAYRLPPPGIKIEDGKLYANTQFPGLSIRYTSDGSDPESDSEAYRDPVRVKGEVRAGTFSSSGRGSRILIESL